MYAPKLWKTRNLPGCDNWQGFAGTLQRFGSGNFGIKANGSCDPKRIAGEKENCHQVTEAETCNMATVQFKNVACDWIPMASCKWDETMSKCVTSFDDCDTYNEDVKDETGDFCGPETQYACTWQEHGAANGSGVCRPVGGDEDFSWTWDETLVPVDWTWQPRNLMELQHKTSLGTCLV
ncbi:unnamed protein product [Amoebophrya sp. A120]|nr:unnamed protein product [Amoebophrya sp. A120]|eukprot:GSA120T00007420001.1